VAWPRAGPLLNPPASPRGVWALAGGDRQASPYPRPDGDVDQRRRAAAAGRCPLRSKLSSGELKKTCTAGTPPRAALQANALRKPARYSRALTLWRTFPLPGESASDFCRSPIAGSRAPPLGSTGFILGGIGLQGRKGVRRRSSVARGGRSIAIREFRGPELTKLATPHLCGQGVPRPVQRGR